MLPQEISKPGYEQWLLDEVSAVGIDPSRIFMGDTLSSLGSDPSLGDADCAPMQLES